jgi:PNKP adenylyltransferase domain, ligase domain
MVVKPLNFIAEGRRGITQPAIKCRGPEYLRIIYGPEYLLPANLERLRSRNVGANALSPAGSSRWGSRRWSALCARNPCGVPMNASLAFWRWRASRSIQGCRRQADTSKSKDRCFLQGEFSARSNSTGFIVVAENPVFRELRDGTCPISRLSL